MSFYKKRENVVHSRKCAPEDTSTDMQPKLRLTGSYNKGINGNKEVHQERFSKPFFENWPCRRQRKDFGNFCMVTFGISRDGRSINKYSSQLRSRTVFEELIDTHWGSLFKLT